jgi:hypothetical protein
MSTLSHNHETQLGAQLPEVSSPEIAQRTAERLALPIRRSPSATGPLRAHPIHGPVRTDSTVSLLRDGEAQAKDMSWFQFSDSADIGDSELGRKIVQLPCRQLTPGGLPDLPR